MTTSSDFIELPDGRRITSVRLFIHQPKLKSEPLEWSCTVPELFAFADTARLKANAVRGAAQMKGVWNDMEWSRVYLNENPNDEDCAFCRAKPTCPAEIGKLERELGASFQAIADDPTELKVPDETTSVPKLNDLMKITDLLEDFIKAVRAEVERRLLAGEVFEDFGLELGRKGNKEFTDEEAAEALLRTLRLKVDQMYTKKLKTPTQLEKLTKPQKTEEGEEPAILSARQWAKVAALVTQRDPKPSVKPKSAIKEPYSPQVISTDAFKVVEDEEPLY